MASNNSSGGSSGGIGFVGLLTIVFIVLKLTGVIAWSWWWVLAPLWISGGLGLAVLAVLGLILLGAHLSDKRRVRKFKARRLSNR